MPSIIYFVPVARVSQSLITFTLHVLQFSRLAFEDIIGPILLLRHIDHTADTVAGVHVVEALVNFRKCAVVSNIFINLEFAL